VLDDVDLKVEIASSPYVTQAIFNKYINEVLIPAVISNRGLPRCKDKPVILFCDNCSAHCSDEVLGKLAKCGILVIADPPHTSHIFQVLDVLLFGILKKAKKYQRRDDTLRREVDHVLRLFRAYEQATASTKIRAFWLKTGFDYETRDAATYLILNETKIRQGDALREVWLFDYHPLRTSKKRASQRWGWINEHLFRKTGRRFRNK
jgi:transposase